MLTVNYFCSKLDENFIMNDDNELQRLLKNLDSIVDEINQVLLSIPSKKQKGISFLSSKSIPILHQEDSSLLLTKINEYKKLRKYTHDNELEVFSLMDIFSSTEDLVKKISEEDEDNVSEYIGRGFFKKFSDISNEVKRLLA
jgi:hypothetical protein